MSFNISFEFLVRLETSIKFKYCKLYDKKRGKFHSWNVLGLLVSLYTFLKIITPFNRVGMLTDTNFRLSSIISMKSHGVDERVEQ